MSGGFNNSGNEQSADLKGIMFSATVVDNLDPLYKQRVKVVIPNLLEGPVDDLPWISPALQSDFGSLSYAYNVSVPVKDSSVGVFFQDGDLNFGMYDCTFAPRLWDNDQYMRRFIKNYPNRRGWRDPGGNMFIIDSTPGKTMVEMRHRTGSLYRFDDDGSITLELKADMEVTDTSTIPPGFPGTPAPAPSDPDEGRTMIFISPDGYVTVRAKKDVTIRGEKVHINPPD